MSQLATALEEAGGTAAPRERSAQLRNLLRDELARSAREIRPGLRVLLTSGFVGEGRVIEGREFPLLDKPYEAAVLSSTLRKLLDRPERKSRRRASAPAE